MGILNKITLEYLYYKYLLDIIIIYLALFVDVVTWNRIIISIR